MERERWTRMWRWLNQFDNRYPHGRALHSDAVIVAVFFWSVLWDRPVSWVTCHKNWPTGLRRFALPSQSCMIRIWINSWSPATSRAREEAVSFRFHFDSELIQMRMSRRLRTAGTEALLDRVTGYLKQIDEPASIKLIDAKPLPISRHRQDADASFGRGAGGMDKGYKLYTIWPIKSLFPAAWQLHAMNVSEPVVAERVGRHADRSRLPAGRQRLR